MGQISDANSHLQIFLERENDIVVYFIIGRRMKSRRFSCNRSLIA